MIESDRLWNELNSQTTPFDFTVIPAVTNETQTTLEVLDNVRYATVNQVETHQIYARDVYGNAKQDKLD